MDTIPSAGNILPVIHCTVTPFGYKHVKSKHDGFLFVKRPENNYCLCCTTRNDLGYRLRSWFKIFHLKLP